MIIQVQIHIGKSSGDCASNRRRIIYKRVRLDTLTTSVIHFVTPAEHFTGGEERHA